MNYAGAFQISNSVLGVSSERNIYRNCFTAHNGGVYTLTKTLMTDTESEFSDNAALSGGVFKCDTCSIEITNSEFNNNRAGDGGVFLFDN